MYQPDIKDETRKRVSPPASDQDPVARWMAIGLMVIILVAAVVLMIGAVTG